MTELNPIGAFHARAQKGIEKSNDKNKGKDEDYDRLPFDKLATDGINYRCNMKWDVDKKGKLVEVPDWSGTTFTVRTKDGHERTYKLSYTDIRDKDELNKMILTMRKFVSDLNLVQTKNAIKGKTFSITEKLGNASNYICLLKLDGPRGLRPIVTGSRYHRKALGLGSATIDNKQGFYGLDLGRLTSGKNGRLKTGLYNLINGNMRGSAGSMINMANPHLPKFLQLHTAGLALVDMNKVAGDIKKYGKGDELWQASKKLQLDNKRRVIEEPAPVEVNLLGDELDVLAADLVERNYMLKAKQVKLRSDRLRGTAVSEELKAQVKDLHQDVAGLLMAILFRKMDNNDQKNAIEGLGILWQMRKETRKSIAAQRLLPPDLQDLQMERHEKRLQQAIDQIIRIVRIRTALMQQEEPNPNHLEALKRAQSALLQFPEDPAPQDLDEAMEIIRPSLAEVNSEVFTILERLTMVMVGGGIKEDKTFDAYTKEHGCTIDQLTDAQSL